MYSIKTEIRNADPAVFDFPNQKTMYAGRKIDVGDTIYIFASENEGGTGLIARGVVKHAAATPRKSGIERQTPRVSIQVHGIEKAKRSIGRKELKTHNDWDDGKPETELNFKFYRQATNKIVGLSNEAAAFLEGYF